VAALKRSTCPSRIVLLMLAGWFISRANQAVADVAWIPIGPEGGRVRNVVQHPTQAQVLYLTAGEAQTSLYKSTDRGSSWNRLAVFYREIFCLAVNPLAANEMFAGSYSQFFRSTDGGITWTTAYSGAFDFRDLSADSSNPNLLHACGYSYASGTGQYIMTYFRSTDKGSSWSVKPLTDLQSFGQAVCVDPKNSNLIFVGGYNAEKSSAAQLYKTTDGGTTWSDVSGNLIGAVSDIAMDAGGMKRVFAVTGAGVFKSTDLGGSWSQNGGYVYGNAIALDRKNPNMLYLGGNEQTYRSTDGGANWTTASNGVADGGLVNSILVDRTASSTVCLGSEAGFYKSTDGGQNWSASNSGVLSTNITALANLSSNPAVAYAARQNGYVFKTQNAVGKAAHAQSVTWEKFYRIPNCDSYSVKTILFDPNVADKIYLYKEFG
jgi:photosystem II stability/assembly factor-like uncharacterized protein